MATPGTESGVPGREPLDREEHDGHYERTTIGLASDSSPVPGNEVAIDAHS